MVKPVVKLLIVTLLAITMAACDNETSSSNNDIKIIPELETTNEDIKELRNEYSRDLILKSADDRSRTLFIKNLNKLTAQLKFLSRFPNNKNQLDRTIEIISFLEYLPLPRKDRARLEPILMRATQAVNKLAIERNVALDDSNTILFVYDFFNGIAPFTSFSTKDAQWEKENRGAVDPLPYALGVSTPGNSNKAYLVSPSFNLKDVTSLKLTLRHVSVLGDGQSDFTRAIVKREAYKLLYSTNYSGGKTLCFDSELRSRKLCPDNAPVWKMAPLQNPTGNNFNKVTTEPMDLSFLAGNENVHFALLLDADNAMRQLIGNRYLRWEVEEFKLQGSGFLPKPEQLNTRIETVFDYEFTDPELKPLIKENSVDAPKVPWRSGSHNGKLFAINEVRNTTNLTESEVANLIYPNIDLNELNQDNDVFLTLNHTLNYLDGLDYSTWDRIKLFISRNYSADIKSSDATWNELNIENRRHPAKSWRPLTAANIDLSEYAGESISLMFRFQPEPGDLHTWQLNYFKLTDKKETDVK